MNTLEYVKPAIGSQVADTTFGICNVVGYDGVNETPVLEVATDGGREIFRKEFGKGVPQFVADGFPDGILTITEWVSADKAEPLTEGYYLCEVTSFMGKAKARHLEVCRFYKNGEYVYGRGFARRKEKWHPRFFQDRVTAFWPVKFELPNVVVADGPARMPRNKQELAEIYPEKV